MAHVLELLIAERDRLDQAIAVLQGTAPRRGRPPGGRKKAVVAAGRQRQPMSAAARKRHSERMKAYWAAKRKAAKNEV